MVLRLFVLSLLLTGCSLEVDYAGTSYRCSVTADCPSDQACMAELCQPVGGAAPDASLPAPPPDAEAVPADAGPPPNLLADPGFELGVDGWNGYLGSTTTVTSTPHSGTHALKVCKDDTGRDGFFSVFREVIVDRADLVPLGAHFHAEMWVRASRNNADPRPSFLAPMIRERGGALPFFDHRGDELSPVTASWTLISADGVITGDGRSNLAIVVEAGDEPDGTCFFIDDVYIARVD